MVDNIRQVIKYIRSSNDQNLPHVFELDTVTYIIDLGLLLPDDSSLFMFELIMVKVLIS